MTTKKSKKEFDGLKAKVLECEPSIYDAVNRTQSFWKDKKPKKKKPAEAWAWKYTDGRLCGNPGYVLFSNDAPRKAHVVPGKWIRVKLVEVKR